MNMLIPLRQSCRFLAMRHQVCMCVKKRDRFRLKKYLAKTNLNLPIHLRAMFFPVVLIPLIIFACPAISQDPCPPNLMWDGNVSVMDRCGTGIGSLCCGVTCGFDTSVVYCGDDAKICGACSCTNYGTPSYYNYIGTLKGYHCIARPPSPPPAMACHVNVLFDGPTLYSTLDDAPDSLIILRIRNVYIFHYLSIGC